MIRRVSPTALRSVPGGPRDAAVGTADHAIPPAELLAMARQAHARITIVPGAPHLSMVSDPGIVTKVILDAVHAAT